MSFKLFIKQRFQYLQFQFSVERGSSGKGYVALDDVVFKMFEECPFTPEDAKPGSSTLPPATTTTTKGPTTAPPTTTVGPPTTTTVEPTEPPDCKFFDVDNV